MVGELHIRYLGTIKYGNDSFKCGKDSGYMAPAPGAAVKNFKQVQL